MKADLSSSLFSDTALAVRLEMADAKSNLAYVGAKQQIYPESNSAWAQIGDGYAVFTGLHSPINRVHGLGMSRMVTGDEVDAAAEFFRSRGRASAIDLCPLAHPALAELLRTRGYAIAGFKHVLVVALDHDLALPPNNPAITVAAIEPAQRKLWATVVAGSFAGSAPTAADLEIPLPTAHKADTVCFLAWLDGQAAGGGALTIYDGTAICFSTAVQPGLRRLGVQCALLHARIAWAVTQGCDLAMVQTTPGSASQRNVERFGFRIAYTKPTVEMG